MWEPFGIAPANKTAYWKEGSNERSTYDIVSTCIITLFLCAYTSLHVNIPEHGKTTWPHQLWRKMLWVLVGVVAPEIVSVILPGWKPLLRHLQLAFVAFREWLISRNFESEMDGLLQPLLSTSNMNKIPQDDIEIGSSPEAGSTSNTQTSLNNAVNPEIQAPKKRFRWTRIHSHFALMGGFAFDTSKMSTNIFGPAHTRRTLKPPALRLIAKNEPDLLPDLSEEAILDKSKANGFAKFLVCVQAFLFSTQAIGRLVTSNPISLLELNTLLHAFCCLVIFMAWWNKPLNIDEPFLIDASDERTSKVCAWMAVEEGIGLWTHRLTTPLGASYFVLKYISDIGQELSSADHETNSEFIANAREHNKQCNRAEEVDPDTNNAQWEMWLNKERLHLTLYPGQTLFGFTLITNPRSMPNKFEPWYYEEANVKIHPSDIESLRLAHSLRKEDGTDKTWRFSDRHQKMFVDRASMISVPDQALYRWKSSLRSSRVINDPDKVLWTGLFFTGAFYGGIHLLAWNGPFSSLTEQWMWRVSCFIIASPGIVMFFLLPFELTIDNLIDWFVFPIDFAGKKFGENAEFLMLLTMGPALVSVVAIFTLLYSAARVYIIVECFINLFHLPLEVYKKPEWSQYILQISGG